MKVRLISPANLELGEAVRYYDRQFPGLGYRFFQEISASIERIRLMPEAWAMAGKRTIPFRAPLYDEVFYEGVKWLDSLAGEPVEPQEGEITFSKTIWKSPARTVPDVS